MASKSILLALADPQALVDITQALGEEWEPTSVSTEADALAQLEQRSFDALLVDFNLGSPDASELLNQALEKRPEMTRFLLAYEADLALVAAKVSGPHEILSKPVEPASLKSRIQSGLAPADPKCSPSGGEPGAGISAAPVVPAVYAEVLKALDSPGAKASQVGKIIAGDAALRSEVLRLANSAYLGLRRDITDPVEAVKSLGLDAVKALVMALQFLAEHSQLNAGYLSLEKLWQHSTHVAQIARDLVLFETKDRVLASEALAAGLLHDLGKVVLASRFDDWYGRVHSLARKQPVALWDVEKEMFGANHGELGACLLGMWNLPACVVEAAALHHEPPLGEHQHLTPLAAVHVANVLEHELRPSEEFRVAPVINPAFLNEIGLLQRLPEWRAEFANLPAPRKRPARVRRRVRASARRRPASAGQESEPAETSEPQFIPPVPSSAPPPRTANQLPAPAAATLTATLGQPESEDAMPVAPAASRKRRWVYAGAAAAVLGLLALWLGAPPDQPVRALTPAPAYTRAAVVVSPAPAAVPEPTLAMADSKEAMPAMSGSGEASATVAASFLNPAPSLPEPEATVPTTPQVAATVAPPLTAAPQEKPQPEFRLSGIIYTAARPSAIVNRQMVYVGDQVSGATVVGIDRTQVTLQINGQRKTFALR
jgi:HD-like signal output (HDOD) protein